jgi:hypothetical protein
MKARLTGSIVLVFVTGGHLTAVAVVHRIERDASQIGVVIVQVLLGVGVEANAIRAIDAIDAVTILDSGNVARGVRLRQLGHAIGWAGIAGPLGFGAQIELNRAAIVCHVFRGRSIGVAVGLTDVILVNLRSFAKSVSRQRLLSLTMTISLPTIRLGLRAGGLGKGQIKRSGGGREFRTITSSITAH